MTSKRTVYLVLPVVAIVVLFLTYLRTFSSTLVIAVLVVLYFAVSLLNRRKFSKKEEPGRAT